MKAITVERNAGIVTITLNRPEKRNAYSPQMADDFAAADVVVFARLGRGDEARDLALGEFAVPVRTAVRQSEELAGDVEDHDGAAARVDELSPAGRDFIGARDDTFRHQASR